MCKTLQGTLLSVPWKHSRGQWGNVKDWLETSLVLFFYTFRRRIKSRRSMTVMKGPESITTKSVILTHEQPEKQDKQQNKCPYYMVDDSLLSNERDDEMAAFNCPLCDPCYHCSLLTNWIMSCTWPVRDDPLGRNCSPLWSCSSETGGLIRCTNRTDHWPDCEWVP